MNEKEMATKTLAENKLDKPVFSMERITNAGQEFYNSLNKIISNHVENCTQDIVSVCSSFDNLSCQSVNDVSYSENTTVSDEDREFCNPALNILRQAYRDCGVNSNPAFKEASASLQDTQHRNLGMYLSSFNQTLADTKRTESRLQHELLNNVRKIIQRPLATTNLQKQMSKLKQIQLIINNCRADIENVGIEMENKRSESVTDKLGLIGRKDYDVHERGFKVLQYKDKIQRQEQEIRDLQAESEAKSTEIKVLNAELAKELYTNRRLMQQQQRWESQPVLEIIKKIIWA